MLLILLWPPSSLTPAFTAGMEWFLGIKWRSHAQKAHGMTVRNMLLILIEPSPQPSANAVSWVGTTPKRRKLYEILYQFSSFFTAGWIFMRDFYTSAFSMPLAKPYCIKK